MKKRLLLFCSIAFLNFGYAQKANLPAGQQPVYLIKNGFYENKGQVHDQYYKPNSNVNYLFCSPGFNVALRKTGFSYDTYTDAYDSTTALNTAPIHPDSYREKKIPEPTKCTRNYHRVDIELAGCNTYAQIIAEGKSAVYYNYFTAGTPLDGVSDVHYYQKIIYKNIYHNIDLEFMIREAGVRGVPIEYQFVIHKGGNPSDIKLVYNGANKVSLRENKIIVNVAAGNFTESIPSSYFKNNMQAVEVSYTALGNNVFAFSLPQNITINSDLVIDPIPTLQWGTYYGGTGQDLGMAMDLDDNGNVFITGYGSSTSNMATVGSYQAVYGGGGTDAYIAKFNPDGNLLLWGTYYGGIGGDAAYGIALDVSNNIYIAGYITNTTNTTTAGAYQTIYGGGVEDAFVAKFNANGTAMLWATSYGGTGQDVAWDIALDLSNNVYIVGETQAGPNISTIGAYQPAYGGGVFDAFVAKFDPTGSSLLWGTFYGGTGVEQGFDIAVDNSNNVYITGIATSTSNIATIGAYQATNQGGAGDAFVAKFSSTGNSIIWASYYGGGGGENSLGIAIDANNDVYITGYTSSSSKIATVGAYQTTFGGGNNDGFVAKFNSTGTGLLWGTYYGGASGELNWNMALDASNNVYVVGSTSSTNNIATAGAYQTSMLGSMDGFVAEFNSTGSSLLWGTYYGGTGNDWSNAIAIDATCGLYISGVTFSANTIATTGAYQTTFGGTVDAFAAKFSVCSILTLTNDTTICEGTCADITVTATSGTPPYTYNWQPGGLTTKTINVCPTENSTYTITVTDSIGLTATDSVRVTVNPKPIITVNSPDICTGQTANLIAAGGTTYIWSTGADSTDVNTADASPTVNTTYTVIGTNSGCSDTAYSTVTVFNPSIGTFNFAESSYCKSNPNPLPIYSGGGVAGTFSSSAGLVFVSTNSGEINLLASTPGTYTVINIVPSSAPCPSDTATANITIIAPPVATFNYSSPFCQNSINTLPTFIGGGSAGIFSSTAGLVFVNTSTGEINLSASAPGTYTVSNIVSSSTPCPPDTATASIIINASPTASIVGDTSICEGSSTTLTATGGGTYVWNTNETTDSITLSPIANTNYSVIVSNVNCSDTATINVIVNKIPVVNINADTTICSDTPIELYSGVGDTYNWLPITALSCSDCQNPIASPEEEISYCVTVSDNGCSDSACVTISIQCESFFIPNAFSPNNNGLNEVFKPEVIGVHDYKFLIFDRWGEQLFETNDTQHGWNGYYKGQVCLQDVYVYKIVFLDNTNNEEHQYIGRVTLLR